MKPDGNAILRPPEREDEIGRLGNYRVLEEIGRGGRGIVFLAEDPALQRQVALKVMNPTASSDPSAAEDFLREARAAAAIEHDNVVVVHEVGEDNGVPFIAMPLLRGESLRARLDHEGKLKVEDAVRIGREFAEGLAAAHARSLVHRDIKPDNIWLEEPDGRVKILDFGLAEDIGAGGSADPERVRGTPHYIAPEQAGGGAVDHRADLFSLGAVLYQMLSGERAFQGDTVASALVSIAECQPEPLASRENLLPQSLAELVTKLLSKSPNQRPQSAAEVAAALAEIETHLQAGWKQRSRRSRLAVLAGGAAILIVAALAISMVGRKREPPSAVAPFSADEARQHQEAWAKHLGVPVTKTIDLGEGVTIEFVLIPPGEFTMGASEEKIEALLATLGSVDHEDMKRAHRSESPEHLVELTRPFWMARTEVTRAQFKRFVDEEQFITGAEKNGGALGGPGWKRAPRFVWTHPPDSNGDRADRPVTCVNSEDAFAFCAWLSSRVESLSFDLPTEAQWEFACRAGSESRYFFGESSDRLARYAWYNWSGSALGDQRAVGQLEPNPFGLYDCYGNAAELCSDWWSFDYYRRSPSRDPQGADSPYAHPSWDRQSDHWESRVGRGGNFFHDQPSRLRSAARQGISQYGDKATGFRPIAIIED